MPKYSNQPWAVANGRQRGGDREYTRPWSRCLVCMCTVLRGLLGLRTAKARETRLVTLQTVQTLRPGTHKHPNTSMATDRPRGNATLLGTNRVISRGGVDAKTMPTPTSLHPLGCHPQCAAAAACNTGGTKSPGPRAVMRRNIVPCYARQAAMLCHLWTADQPALLRGLTAQSMAMEMATLGLLAREDFGFLCKGLQQRGAPRTIETQCGWRGAAATWKGPLAATRGSTNLVSRRNELLCC